ncbi:MAG: aminotransferase class I/II-fold pyridoxal phosphate-dependent enzyme [Clostridiales bacterium]|nr:aminotransferase class I/II-fold pyridoxal phosphate-dependent enzyme [Clostridiales bacterium]MBR5975627.1 aminotransferase class I/II-fold pyridoxal phosphate-dependent enzyme [Clostridiales bacterium]
MKRQNRAPIAEALEEYTSERVVPFDVPGHKHGRGNPELTAFLGERTMTLDVNSMKPLDNLCHPVSVIKDAEELAAEAFGARAAFFMVGGTTSSVQAMVFTVAARGDKIIVPRNVHRSVIYAMVLCGAIPVYVDPGAHEQLGIALGMTLPDIENAIRKNPDAKAIFVNNPTYYGICSDLRGIVNLAHAHGMQVIVDEAHGTHLSFSDKLPVSAMEAGADMAAVSMHKSGGSLTQSSFLLVGGTGDMQTSGERTAPEISPAYVRQIINLTQTTSGSYLFLSSLDLSRKRLALHGKELFDKVIDMAEYARSEINSIGGYYAIGSELVDGKAICDFDKTKLVIHTLPVGLAGIEVYDLLRDEYDIQMEFGDFGNCLAYLSVGDRVRELERLVGALSEIRRHFGKDPLVSIPNSYIAPIVALSPQEAFYAKTEHVDFGSSVGRIAAESIMCYPPGIPVLAPGERITEEVLEYLRFAQEKGCQITGAEDSSLSTIRVVV